MAPRFTPALGQTTVLPLFPSTTTTAATADLQGCALYFTYVPSNGFAAGKTPEVWTNLPLLTSSAGAGEQLRTSQWHAVPFAPSPHATGIFVARVPLASATDGSYEYTFRLRSDGTDHVEWLGSEGSNGHIEVVRLNDQALAAAQKGLGTESEGWRALADGVQVWEGALPEGKDTASFDLSALVGDERWSKAEGIVWEQSARTWFQPRQLPRTSPLSSLSTTFPAQLLVLRSIPTRAHPLPQTVALLPFSTPEASSALYGDGKGGFELRVERDDGKGEVKSRLAVAWSSGAPGSPSLPALLAQCGAATRSTTQQEPYVEPAQVLSAATLKEPKDLGLCTWNALSAEGYSASSVLSWLDALLGPSASSTPLAAAAVRTVLLDDGWQDTSSWIDLSGRDAAHGERRALRSFQCGRDWYDLDSDAADDENEAERVRRAQAAKKHSLDSGYAGSPTLRRRREVGEPREGVCVELRDVVGRIKERGIERVGVWMTLAGYWHGLHPDSSLADAYTLRRVELRSAAHPQYSGHIFLPTASDLPQYYRDYFTSLAAAGIDFVKVDDQALVDSIVAQEVGEDEEAGSVPDAPGTLRNTMLSAMRAAAVEVFGEDGIVHCMAGSPRIWGGALQPGDTVRTSDDFFPLERDSHRWHVANNAFSALLAAQALRLEPDFDMAQAKPACDFAGAHLPLRAFSTAQVFSSDPAPESDGTTGEGWDALLATTKRGVRVLQSRAPGVVGTVLASSAGADHLGHSDGECKPLKVGLPVPSAKGAHIGVWDCAPLGDGESADVRETRATLDEQDVADVLAPLATLLDKDAEVVLFDSEQAATVQVVVTAVKGAADAPRSLAQPLAGVTIAPRQAGVVTLAQLFPLSSKAGGIKVACLGLMGKTVGLAAVRSIGLGLAGQAAEGQLANAAGRVESLVGSLVSSVSSSSSPSGTSSAVSSGRSTPALPQRQRASTFPCPQGRLPFLLAYFANAFHRTASSPSTTPQRTPRTELRSLAQDFVRAPLRTFFGELRALVSFGVAAVLWAVGAGRQHAAAQGRRAVAAAPGLAGDGEMLRIELDYVGQLGLYVSLPTASSSSNAGSKDLPIDFTLDGAPLDPLFVRAEPLGAGKLLVELDLEAAWNKSIGSRPAPEAEAEREGGVSAQVEEVRPWVVEVRTVAATEVQA